MPCYFPLKGYRSRIRNSSGKRGIVFSSNEGFSDQPIEVPCGRCIGCRLEYSRQWAIRCYHEASLYEKNCFITLTYDPKYLPKGNTLVKKHFQNFMKYLRRDFGKDIRFFHCGEYGEDFERPHYHACIFNFDFPDRVFSHFSQSGERLYVSETLSKLWAFGLAWIGEVTFESAAYVARYVVNKVTGEHAKEHYTYIDPGTGEFYERLPEYVTMSRRPGIGARWLDKFHSDVYPSDEVVVRGVRMKPPKYYDRRYYGDIVHIRNRFPRLYELMTVSDRMELLEARATQALHHKDDNTMERLRVRERVKKSKLKQLRRTLK